MFAQEKGLNGQLVELHFFLGGGSLFLLWLEEERSHFSMERSILFSRVAVFRISAEISKEVVSSKV